MSDHKEKETDKKESLLKKEDDLRREEALSKGSVVLSREEYEQLKAEAAKAGENWDRFVRQQADFENMRKRLERQQEEFIKYANEDILLDLLGVLDDLERSVEAAEKKEENFDAFLKGIEMILAHLYELIKKRGVVPIQAKGRPFNPLEQEALMQSESEEHSDGEVIEELQKGYKFQDRVIRTAKVHVAKAFDKEKKADEG